MARETFPISPSRQKRVGESLRRETRNRILEAAAEEFAAHGYAKTTVARLAAAAGVSLQTLYLAWGSKRELLRGYMSNALTGGKGAPDDVSDRFVGLTTRERLVELATVTAEIAERAATGWRLYRDAAAVDTEIAADWNELQLLRHATITRILTDVPVVDLADGLTLRAAIDTAWVIASPESYDLLVNRLEYSLEEFESWLVSSLTGCLLGTDRTRTS